MIWETFFEDWIVEAFWQMMDDLRVQYRIWQDVYDEIEKAPHEYGKTEQEQIENYLLDAVFDNHEDAWWERIHPAQDDGFWENAKNEFFLAALAALEQVIAEPIEKMDEGAKNTILRHFTFRTPLKTPVDAFVEQYGEEGLSRYTDYSERLHAMAYMWTMYFFVHFEVLFPKAREAELFGPHHRRSQFRVLKSRDFPRRPKSSQQTEKN